MSGLRASWARLRCPTDLSTFQEPRDRLAPGRCRACPFILTSPQGSLPLILLFYLPSFPPCRVDFVIVPLKVLESLRNTPAGNRIKRSIAPAADPGSAVASDVSG